MIDLPDDLVDNAARLLHEHDRTTDPFAAFNGHRQPPVANGRTVDPETGEIDGGDPWPEPIPLAAPPPPPFPLDALPDVVARFAVDVAHTIQCPVDLPAMCALGAIAGIATGHIVVRVAEGWDEPVNLYLGIGVPPSGGKSPAFAATYRPFAALEAALRDLAAREIAESEVKQKRLERNLKEAEGRGDDTAMLDLTLELRSHRRLWPPRLLADDMTPEAFTNLLDRHHTITVASSEGGLFGSLNRYTDGKEAQLDAYLKAWSGDRIVVDRKGEPDPKIIEQPLATICLTVQPSTLTDLGRRQDFRERGLPQRFMYALPDTTVGERDLTAVRDSDPAVRADWAELIDTLGRRLHSYGQPKVVRIDPDAWTVLGQWRQHLEHRRGDDLAHIAEWTTKAEASVIRVAGLFATLDRADSIDEATMRRAVQIGWYWLGHALAVWDLADGDEALADARDVWRIATKKGWESAVPRDVMKASNRRYADRDIAERALRVLEERGWARLVDRDRARYEFRPARDTRDTRDTTPTDPVDNPQECPACPASPKDENQDLSIFKKRDSPEPDPPTARDTRDNTPNNPHDVATTTESDDW